MKENIPRSHPLNFRRQMNPLISIIVPVYKAETTLRRCVDSLLQQSYQNVEIVLVDDGSPDGSPAICDEYSRREHCVRTIHLQNGGVSNARNYGMRYSTGDYLCFVDSDDYVDSNYIQNFISGLLPATDLVFQGINEVHSDGTIIRKIPKETRYCYHEILDGISDINKHSMFGYVCNKLYRRSIIVDKALTFKTYISISEDRIFALQYMTYVNEMQVVAKSSYYYILKTTGLTLHQRSYEEIKVAADENLQAALALLQKRRSECFLKDTKRMYVMSATGYLLSLFYEKCSIAYRCRAISLFRSQYMEWLPYYAPVSTDQRMLYKALRCNTVICVFLMQVYIFVIKMKHGKIA